MIRVGLTGNIGSGKSTVVEIFSNLGVPVYDADLNAKRFLLNYNVKNIIRKEFGDKVFDNNNEISKKNLADIVFNNVTKLNKLNAIIHPFVIDDYQIWADENKNHLYTIIEAAILFETGYDRVVNKIITVTCPESVRVKRIMERDNATETEIRQRMKNQWDEELKISKSDYIIVNDQEHILIPQVIAIHKELAVISL